MTAITIPNTFVPSTTISSTAMNANFSAVASAIDGSLALDGSEVMTGQLKAASGSAAAPGVAFSSDLDIGLYRRGANELGFATAGIAAAYFDAAQKLFLLGALDVAGALTGGINPSTALTAPAVLDELLTYDASAAANRKITLADMLKVVALLTAETSPAVDDSLLLYDLSEAAANSITLADALKVINALTALTAVDTEADYAVIYDASASAACKVLVKDIPGRIVQRLYSTTGTFSTSSLIPADGTIPQITEGAQVISQAITPKSATNRIRVYFSMPLSVSGASGDRFACALFNGGANALQVASAYVSDNGPAQTMTLIYEEVAGGVSPITYSVRAGAQGSTCFMAGGYGNADAIFIVEEIVP